MGRWATYQWNVLQIQCRGRPLVEKDESNGVQRTSESWHASICVKSMTLKCIYLDPIRRGRAWGSSDFGAARLVFDRLEGLDLVLIDGWAVERTVISRRWFKGLISRRGRLSGVCCGNCLSVSSGSGCTSFRLLVWRVGLVDERVVVVECGEEEVVSSTSISSLLREVGLGSGSASSFKVGGNTGLEWSFLAGMSDWKSETSIGWSLAACRFVLVTGGRPLDKSISWSSGFMLALGGGGQRLEYIGQSAGTDDSTTSNDERCRFPPRSGLARAMS